MYPRTEYEMTEADLKGLLAAMKPVPLMMIGGYVPDSQQETANAAWAALGAKMGFEPMTVRPVPGKGQRFFTAVPSETETARAERLAAEAEQMRKIRIADINHQIAELQEELAELTEGSAFEEAREKGK